MWQNFGLGFVVNTVEKEKSGNPFTAIPMWQSNSLFFSLFSFTVEKEKSGSPFIVIPMWQSNSLFFSLFSFTIEKEKSDSPFTVIPGKVIAFSFHCSVLQ